MFLIVNEHAGAGKGRRVFHHIERLLRPSDRVAVTKRPGDARRIASEAAQAGHEIVAAVGGDGTVHDTVNGLADCGFKAALGIVPAGSGNDFAYSLGVPAQPPLALRVLRLDHRRRVDLGLISIQGQPERYYANMLGMGLTGEIAAVTRGQKKVGADLAYLWQLLKRMYSARPSRFRIEAEGRVVVAEGGIGAHLANGRREGSIFPVAPLASLDDGLLDLMSVQDVPLLSRPSYIVQVLRGRILQQPGVLHLRVTSAGVEAVDRLPCHADGEPFLLDPGQAMQVQVQPAALQVVGP